MLPATTVRAQPQKTPASRPRAIVVAQAETLAVFSQGTLHTAGTSGAAADVVVFLPGPIGSAFGMRHLTSALADSGTATVVVDLLGMGMSSRTSGANYSLSQQSLRLGAVLDSLAHRRVLLVAHGVTASVALRFAAANPAKVSGIVSISGGPVDAQKTNGIRTAMTFSRLIDNPIGRALGRRKLQGNIRESSANEAWFTNDVMREYLAPYEKNLRGSLRSLQQMSEAGEPVAIATLLPQVAAPVRLLIGAKTSGSTPTAEQVAVLGRSLADFRVDTVAHSGTLIHEEQPGAVLLAIRDLIRLRSLQDLAGAPARERCVGFGEFSGLDTRHRTGSRLAHFHFAKPVNPVTL